jgi:transcriptional regulator with XRE-family HTH domain
MAEGDSPTVARRRVRMALRDARESAGLTQHEVAVRMEWSLSKIIRIENGDVAIAPNDLRPLLAYLGVKDRALVTDIVAHAKIARTRQTRRHVWHQSPQFREHLTHGTRRLIEYEAEASSIHSYSVFHIPGPLQIPSYSEALLNMWRDEMSQEQRKVRLDARRMRHDAVLGRLGSLRMTALLDESVFMRAVGGPRVFADQLREILRLVEQGLVSIRMFPFSADAALSYNAGFDILFVGADDDLSDAVLYRESGASDEIVEDHAITERHYRRYQKLWESARGEVDTVRFTEKRIRDLTE